MGWFVSKALICPWCEKPIMRGELTVMVNNEPMHIDCAADDQDDVDFDNSMGFGDK